MAISLSLRIHKLHDKKYIVYRRIHTWHVSFIVCFILYLPAALSRTGASAGQVATAQSSRYKGTNDKLSWRPGFRIATQRNQLDQA